MISNDLFMAELKNYELAKAYAFIDTGSFSEVRKIEEKKNKFIKRCLKLSKDKIDVIL